MTTSPQLKQLGSLIEALRKDPDSHLLVAGGKPSLFTEDVRNLPRVTFWHSTEQSSRQNTTHVPTRTGAIVFNRWVDHGFTTSLRSQARRLAIPMCNVPLAPAVILDLIKEAGLMNHDEAVAETPAKMAPGQLNAFIQKEGNLQAPSGAEIARLFALAQERGLPTTIQSLSTTFYQVRAGKTGVIKVRRMAEKPAEPFLKPAAEALAPNLFAAVLDASRDLRHIIEAGDADSNAPVLDDPTPAMVPPKPDFIVPVDRHSEDPEKLVAEGVAIDLRPKVTASTIDPRQVINLIDDAIVNLQRLTGDATSALQLVKETIENIEPALLEATKLQAKIDKMRAFLAE